MKHHTGKCKQTGKRQYKEPLDVLLDHQQNPRTIRAYQCPHCKSYHATSQPERRRHEPGPSDG